MEKFVKSSEVKSKKDNWFLKSFTSYTSFNQQEKFPVRKKSSSTPQQAMGYFCSMSSLSVHQLKKKKKKKKKKPGEGKTTFEG